MSYTLMNVTNDKLVRTFSDLQQRVASEAARVVREIEDHQVPFAISEIRLFVSKGTVKGSVLLTTGTTGPVTTHTDRIE